VDTQNVNLTLKGGVDTVRIAISNTIDFVGANQIPYSTSVPWVLTAGDGTKTVFVKFFTQYGGVSSIVTATTELVTTPPVIPTPTTTEEIPTTTPPLPPPPLTIASGGVFDPVNLEVLLTAVSRDRDIADEDKVLQQVYADAKEFGLTLTTDEAMADRNFIVYGISTATVKLGQGERRAVMRDYMDTVRRSNTVWTDVQRLTTGQIPISRNLAIERQRVSVALPVFHRIFGHDPNFKNATENLAWNTLMYRIRFTRDMVKEANGVRAFYVMFRHTPVTPFEWSVVRVLGYVK